jgi:hypothetical protein
MLKAAQSRDKDRRGAEIALPMLDAAARTGSNGQWRASIPAPVGRNPATTEAPPNAKPGDLPGANDEPLRGIWCLHRTGQEPS